MDRNSSVLLRGAQRSMVGFVSTFRDLNLSLLALHTSRPHPYLKATVLNPTPSFEFCNSTLRNYSNHEKTTLALIWRIWREKTNKTQRLDVYYLTSVSTCFGHHYAHLQENKGPVTAFGVLFWFCWLWLVAVVGRCLAGCEHCEGFCSTSN